MSYSWGADDNETPEQRKAREQEHFGSMRMSGAGMGGGGKRGCAPALLVLAVGAGTLVELVTHAGRLLG